MGLDIRPYRKDDLAGMMKVWNEVVENGEAFPQIEPLTLATAPMFFAGQTLSVVAALDDKIMGLYTLHPSHVGRCAHIANACYAVASSVRGLGLGRALVEDSLMRAAKQGFFGVQCNAVVAGNTGAIRLFEQRGFARIGTLPNGFVNFLGGYEDLYSYYRPCV